MRCRGHEYATASCSAFSTTRVLGLWTSETPKLRLRIMGARVTATPAIHHKIGLIRDVALT